MKIEFDEYVIRDWQADDALSIVTYANNKKVSKNLRDVFPFPYSMNDAEDFLLNIAQQQTKTVFAIATSSEAIGSIGLTLGQDVHRFTAELGYWLAEPFWNKGIVTKAVNKFTEFAFKKFKLHRIFASPYACNTPSIKVLEKAGFEREGVLRASAFKNNKVLDQILYSKLKEGIR